MASPSSWRQFQLYEFTPIRDPNSSSDELSLYSDATVSAITATEDYLIVADHNAYIKVVSVADFTLKAQFIAYDLQYRVTFVYAVPNTQLVVTVAENQGHPAVIRLWDLAKIIEENEEDLRFKYHSQVLVTNGDNSYPVVSFDFTPDVTCFAVGYANGKVVLVRGDILRDRGSKQRVVYESNNPVTAVHFDRHWDSQLLYVTTTSRMVTVATTGRNQGKPQRVLSNSGVDVNCSDVNPVSAQLVTGSAADISFYDVDGKAKTIKYEIAKSRVVCLGGNHILLATTEEVGDRTRQLVSRVIILDVDHAHVAFNLLIPKAMIRQVVVAANMVYLLCNDGVLYKVEEKPINQQVESIIQRQLFSVAFQLAKDAELSSQFLLGIQKKHVQYLYNEQKYDEAMAVAIDCLDLFTSTGDEDFDDFVMSIIIKYNDTGNIANLTSFLDAVYTHHLATNDHITLLLCCYCKLKQLSSLDLFIAQLDVENSQLQQLDFPLLINLFKECGYYESAIKLLQKLNQPHLIVEIQLKDLQQPAAALQLIKQLPVDELLHILIDYSKTFLDHHPIETTRLLIDVFTGQYSPEDNAKPVVEKTKDDDGVVLTSYKAFMTYLSGESANPEDPAVPPKPTYLPPRPNLIFAGFLNQPNEFVIFLEACLASFDKYQGQIADKKEMLNTLLELYLKLAQDGGENDWKQRATDLITANSGLFDESSLLVISHIYSFSFGEVTAQEQEGYQASLFASYRAAGNIKGCMQIVREEGDSNPEFFKLMLKAAVSSKRAFDEVSTKDIQWIFDRIKEHQLMSPLEVLQTLTEGGNEFVKLGLVKDYLIDHIVQQEREITNNTKLIEHYEQQSSENSLKLTDLKTKPFALNNTKCDECQLKLEFPMVHFKCKHSYHQKCLSNNLVATAHSATGGDNAGNVRCAKCYPHIYDGRDFSSADEVAIFDAMLAESTDKFKIVAQYLGKGVMESNRNQF